MLDPTTLFTWEPHVDQRRIRAHTLVVTLGSYVDAGHMQHQLDEHLLGRLPNRLLGRVDADQVTDYAGHRPTIVFDRNHFSRYDAPTVSLKLLTDTNGTDFLVLSGPEPSLQWERVAGTVRNLVQQLDVRRTVLVQSMPAPAPHTRPVAITRFASDPALVADEEPLLGTFSLSASFTGMLTVRLGEAGHEVLGLLAHVPHYIADAEYSPAVVSMLDALRDATRLVIPRDGFELPVAAVRAQIDSQVQASEELTAMVGALEERYDAFVEQHRLRAAAEQELPSAEEIGQEFERFLADLGEAPGDEGQAGWPDAAPEPPG